MARQVYEMTGVTSETGGRRNEDGRGRAQWTRRDTGMYLHIKKSRAAAHPGLPLSPAPSPKQHGASTRLDGRRQSLETWLSRLDSGLLGIA